MQELEDTPWGHVNFLKTIENLTKYQREKHERKVKTTLSLLRLLPLRSILSTNFTRFFHGIDYIFRSPESKFEAEHSLLTRTRTRVKMFESVMPKHAAAPAVTAYLREFIDVGVADSSVARSLSQQPLRDAKLFLCANDDFQDAEKCMPPLVKGFDPPVLHIHGTSNPTCTRKGYRRLQTDNPSYLEFLRCMFASSRVLFYGYSRSDSYMNDLRDEVMTMLEHGHRPGEDTVAPVLGYHIEDVKEQSDDDVLAMMQYSRRHEGLCVLPIRSTSLSPRCQWTAFLRKLVHATSEQQRFAMSLTGRRILCLEQPYFQAAARSGFEECAYALFVLAHAATSPSGSRSPSPHQFQNPKPLIILNSIFDADAREFKRRRDDYNAVIAALGRSASRNAPTPLNQNTIPVTNAAGSNQALRLPGDGLIVVTFTTEALVEKAGDGSKWDLLVVGWEVEEASNVLAMLRTARCLIPALAHQQFAPSGCPCPSLQTLRHAARSRGFWDFCENTERIYACVQSCFDTA